MHLWQRFFDFSLPKTYTAQSLAIELAKRTRFLKNLVFAEELNNADSEVHSFFEAFRENLITTLSQQQFADIYAQTITYGLFAARSRANGNFNRKLAFEYIPQSIGLLRDVFKFISLGEMSKQMQVIIDEIAQILNLAQIKNILHEFYKQGKGEDPILHFYETFLSNYDPQIRERRGVYYTPEPVVNYIVNAANNILKDDFNLKEGLASDNIKLLDPAAGTMTFPAKAIEVAVKNHTELWGKGDLNNWLRNHILNNFYAFELMMASYAIGHLKIGFILEELGLQLKENERFKLFLTNSLELEDIKQKNFPLIRSLSEESRAAGQIKRQEQILVIIGNPPYSGHSANTNKWTERLLKEDSIEGVKIQSYYKADKKDLGEKNPKWLQDDYVKFLRFAQWKIEQTGFGIVAMITNHSYLDNPTFRGKRQSLMKTFDSIYIINLHGNSLKKETTPAGSKDENVFDIRQGVAIAIFVKHKNADESKVYYRNLYGLREKKYSWLENNLFNQELYEEIKPQSPYYFFVKRETENIKHYLKWQKINEIFPVNSVGIVSARDRLAIAYTKKELSQNLRLFSNRQIPDEIIRKTFKLKDTSNWHLSSSRQEFSKIKNFEALIRPILYRPFDKRFIWYYNSNILIERLRWNVMRNMLAGENLGLITSRIIKWESYFHTFISEIITNGALLASNTASSSYLFPLYLYPDIKKQDLFSSLPENINRKPNINEKLYKKLTKIYEYQPSPEQILYYIYAVFYSNIYRKKYTEFLKIDFPRVPFTKNFGLFKKLAKLGEKLANLHLFKSSLLDFSIAKFEGEGDNFTVEKIKYNSKIQCVYINKDKYFTGIYNALWEYYIGGYQVLNKWLKDRKNRKLSLEDIRTYAKIATALHHTISLQKEIDELYKKVDKNFIT